MSSTINVFVINLPKDTARREFMEQQLTALALPFSIVPATIGSALTETERNSLYSDTLSQAENGYSLSNTQIACADSHRRIYKKIVEENLPYALILEDDVKLHPSILKVIKPEFIANAKADWIQIDYVPADIAYVTNWLKQAWQQKVPLPTKIVRTLFRYPIVLLWAFFERIRNWLSPNDAPYAAWFARPLYLASAYIVTNAGAKKLLPLTEPIRFAADSLQNIAPSQVGLRRKAVVPLLTGQQRKMFTSNLTYDS